MHPHGPAVRRLEDTVEVERWRRLGGRLCSHCQHWRAGITFKHGKRCQEDLSPLTVILLKLNMVPGQIF